MKCMKKIKRIIIPVLSVFSFSLAGYIPVDTFRVESLGIDDGFQYEIENNEIVITGYEDTREPEQVIPEKINGLPVTTIRYLSGNIEELVIPPSVKKIESKAFKSNYRLKSVLIPESVTEIGTYILQNCEELEYCKFDAQITEIPTGTFSGCISLTEIDYSSSIESLGEYVFSDCNSLKSVDIPGKMKELPNGMLDGCSSLTSVDLPDNLLKIGNRTFKDCSGLTEINIPDSVESIGEYAFSGCSSVKELVIPEKVEIISDGLFNDCTSLSKVVLPKNALSYYENNSTRVYSRDLFRNCSSLTKIYLPYGLTDIGENCFDGCTSLKSVSIPDTVEYIQSYAFRDCSSLTQINIPAYSTVDGVETFCNCSSLKELYVPETVYSIGYNCRATFKNCSSLEYLYLPQSSDISSEAFKDCDKLKEIYIGSLNATFGIKNLGYIYDEKTDTYVKNENLKILCRDGSTAQKYAEENGLNYEIVSGYNAKITYISTYSKGTEEPKPLHISSDETAFINGAGEYRISDTGILYDKIDDITDILISTDISKEDFSNLKIIPTNVNFDGVDISEIYNDVSYDFKALDDGLYYLLIHAEGSDISSKEIKFGKVNVSFDVYLDGIPEYIMGDVNLDGAFNISDAVLLQKWLSGATDVKLANWFAGDFTEDGKLDVFDICLMKRALMSNN